VDNRSVVKTMLVVARKVDVLKYAFRSIRCTLATFQREK